MNTWQAKHKGTTDADFKTQLLADPEVAKLLPKDELDALCSLEFHLKEVDNRFKQLGLPT